MVGGLNSHRVCIICLGPTPVRKHAQIRSSSSDLFVVPKVNTNIGTSAFAVGAPTL